MWRPTLLVGEITLGRMCVKRLFFFAYAHIFIFFVFQSRHALLTHICINTYANARADCQVVVHLHICRKRERGSERGRERVRERERE